MSELRKMGRKGFAKICPENSFFIMSKEKGKLGYFWKHAFEVAESGPNNGSVISIDSGLTVKISSGGNLTRLSFDANKYDGTLNRPNKGTCWLQRYAATRCNVMPPLATKRCTVIPPPVSDETRHPFQSIPPSEATSLSETSLQQG